MTARFLEDFAVGQTYPQEDFQQTQLLNPRQNCSHIRN